MAKVAEGAEHRRETVEPAHDRAHDALVLQEAAANQRVAIERRSMGAGLLQHVTELGHQGIDTLRPARAERGIRLAKLGQRRLDARHVAPAAGLIGAGTDRRKESRVGLRSARLGFELHRLDVALESLRAPARRAEVLAVDTSGHRRIAKSTAYTAFDHERDFREQLARTLLSSERVRDASVMGDVYATLADRPGGPPPIGVAFGELVTAELERIRSFAAPTVEVGAITFSGHPLLRELLGRLVEGAADAEVETSVAAVYQRVLDGYGWRMQQGLTVADLTTALRALLLGYLFFGRVWPSGVSDEVPWDENGTRSVVSLAVEGVVHRFTEPNDQADGAGSQGGLAASAGLEVEGSGG